MVTNMGNTAFKDNVMANLAAGRLKFERVLPEGGGEHDGTDHSNEVSQWSGPDGLSIIIKTMLTSHKYHQKRKAICEMVHAWLDEGLGGMRVVPKTFAIQFELTDEYRAIWGEKPKEIDRVRVCQVIHDYVSGVPGDEWRGQMYSRLGNLPEADYQCRAIIERLPNAERIALLDFLTINQDRSARNWLTEGGRRFWAIDNGMAWFHEYPLSDDWKIGAVIDDVLIQTKPWQFISGVFTTSYAGRPLSTDLLAAMRRFSWLEFSIGLNRSCDLLGLVRLAFDWRITGLKRRFNWITNEGRFPTGAEYRSWLCDGSSMMTPPEIMASGGQLIWSEVEDKP